MLADAVLRQCIRSPIGAACAPGHHGYQRACDLISGQASTGPLGPQAVVVRVAMGGCTRAPYSICGWYGRNCRRPIRVGRCHKRSMTRATCVGDHSPDPRAVGMACAFNPSAMARSDVAPACRNAAMIGTLSAARRAARFCSAPRASGASPCRALAEPLATSLYRPADARCMSDGAPSTHVALRYTLLGATASRPIRL